MTMWGGISDGPRALNERPYGTRGDPVGGRDPALWTQYLKKARQGSLPGFLYAYL